MTQKLDLKPNHIALINEVMICIEKAKQDQLNLEKETKFNKKDHKPYCKTVLTNDYKLFLNHFNFDNGCRYSDVINDVSKAKTRYRLLNNLIVYGILHKKRFNEDNWLSLSVGGKKLLNILPKGI